MVLALDPPDVDKTLEALKAAGETAYVVGTCEAGEKGVTYVKSSRTGIRRRNESAGDH